MGRAERRKAERRERLEFNKNKIVMTRQDLGKMKSDIIDEVCVYNGEALMTCFALAEHRLYGHGQKRLLRTLAYVDQLMGAVSSDLSTIEDYKRELKEETGVVIRG